MRLETIKREKGLTPETFKEGYLRPMKPVIFTDLMDDWPAKDKWTIEFFKAEYGNLPVPVFSANYTKPGPGYMKAEREMPFREYLEALEAGPTDWRLFLFNVFKAAPELCKDFWQPTIMEGFLGDYPFMFFGGEGSSVDLHYDIDMSHVFLNQFHGRKKVLLFPPEQSTNIYHNPFTVGSSVDLSKPDYDRFPALRQLRGYECVIRPGETLFMPSGYWHFITYLDGGYSISLRASDSYSLRIKGLANIARHYIVNKGMNRLMGENWEQMKTQMARRRAEGR